MGAFGNTFGNKLGTRGITPYYKKLIKLFGSHIIELFSEDEQVGTTVVDRSGNGFHGTYTGIVTLNQSGIFSKPSMLNSVNGYIVSNTSISFKNKVNFAEGYFSLWCKATDNSLWASTCYVLLLQANANDRIVARTDISGNLYLYYTGGGVTKYIVAWGIYGVKFFNLGFRWSKSADKLDIFINGTKVTSTQISESGLGNIGAYNASFACNYLSWAGSNSLLTKSSNILLLDYAPSDSEIMSSVSPDGCINFEGDSRSYEKNWIRTVPESIKSSSVFGFGKFGRYNTAIPGDWTGSMATRASTTDAKIISGKTNILVVWCGVNGASWQSGLDIYNALKSYCIARRDAGWNKIIICSEIDAQGAVNTAWHSTIYLALNTLIRNDYSFADILADLGARSELQDATNMTYFNVDRIHLTTAGYDVVSSVVGNALEFLNL